MKLVACRRTPHGHLMQPPFLCRVSEEEAARREQAGRRRDLEGWRSVWPDEDLQARRDLGIDP